MTVFYSAKGGSGCTVLTALVGVLAARKGHDVVVTSFDHDLATVLGTAGLEGQLGLRDWVAVGEDRSVESLQQLFVNVAPRLDLLPPGSGAERVSAIPDMRRNVLIDASGARDIAHGGRAVLVTRPCLLALKRATAERLAVDAVVVIDEAGRAIDRRDIEDIVGKPVVTVLPFHSNIARSVDAGRVTELQHRAIRPVERLVDWIFRD